MPGGTFGDLIPPVLTAQREAQAVARVLAGDADAYDLLVRGHMRMAYALAYRILQHAQDAEDVVQDAFFAALERLDTFETTRRFGPWLYRIVTNLALNHHKARTVRATESLDAPGRTPHDGDAGGGTNANMGPTRHEHTPVAAGLGSDPQRDAESAQIRDHFTAALAHLAPQPRLIVTLVDLDGWRPTDVAEALELSPGTVRGYLHEARRQLRDALAVFQGDGR